MHHPTLNMARSMIFACNLSLHFLCDTVEYTAYILNRSPTSANSKHASPPEVLSHAVPDMQDIVVFGLTCGVQREPGKNSLQRRSEKGTIVGRNDETKGYRIYLRKSITVITTQHVRNIATLTEEQNARLLRGISSSVDDDSANADTDPTIAQTSAKKRH